MTLLTNISKSITAYYLNFSVTIVDILDDDVEADKKRIRERWLPVDSPLLFISDDICKSSPKMSHPVGGTGEG